VLRPKFSERKKLCLGKDLKITVTRRWVVHVRGLNLKNTMKEENFGLRAAHVQDNSYVFSSVLKGRVC
jgi:hypothetical protein